VQREIEHSGRFCRQIAPATAASGRVGGARQDGQAARAMSDRDTFPAGFEYLPSLPASLPDHRVLVHNKGGRFRAWLQENDATLEVCPCAFASELGRHYVPMSGPRGGGKTLTARASGH